MSDTNIPSPVIDAPVPPSPQPVQSPTEVVSGVDTVIPTPLVSSPPVELHETTVEVSKPVEEPKGVEVVEENAKPVETPYSFVLCPKCGTEIKEEYFFENKKSSITNQGKALGFTVRTEETGDRVFLVSDKKRYWLKNPETLTKLGFSLGSEKNVPFSELLQYPEYEPIDLTVPGSEFPRKDEISPEEKIKTQSNKPYKVWA